MLAFAEALFRHVPGVPCFSPASGFLDPSPKRDFRSFLVDCGCMDALFADVCACPKCHVYHAFRLLF